MAACKERQVFLRGVRDFARRWIETHALGQSRLETALDFGRVFRTQFGGKGRRAIGARGRARRYQRKGEGCDSSCE
jgi:hypothetical protein